MAIQVHRVQTGVRVEKRLLKVLKATATHLDLSLGELIEGITLHAFEGRAPFGADTLAHIAALRPVYGLTLTAADSHLLVEVQNAAVPRSPRRRGPDRRAAAGR